MFEIPLLAAQGWEAILRALVPLVFLLIWVIGKIVEENKKLAAKKAVQQPPASRANPRPQPAAAPASDGGRRRAEGDPSGRRGDLGDQRNSPRQPEVAAEPSIQILLNEPAAPVRRSTPRPPRPAPRRPARQRPAATPRARQPTKTPPAHAVESQHLDERAEHFGEEITQADEKLASRLHRKFDHQLGQFGGDFGTDDDYPSADKIAPPTNASEIAQALANPVDVRQAIILSEILQRPIDRWDF